MAIRNCLVLVSGDGAEPALEAAFLLVKKSGGRVTGLHITGDAVMNMPVIIEGMTERQIVREFQNMHERVGGAEKAAHTLFAAACEKHGAELVDKPVPGPGIAATWNVVGGRPDRILSEKSRAYDLLITSVVGNTAGDTILEAVEHALFDAGRPVLVVPREVPKSVATNVVIGWNRSANAARAVMAAMPLLVDAAKVVIGHVNTGAKTGPSAEELAASLAWNGVDATVRHIAPSGAPVSDLLMTEAANIGGDLVVMGAYSHSRMREFVLGGVTRHALRHVVTPTLLMH